MVLQLVVVVVVVVPVIVAEEHDDDDDDDDDASGKRTTPHGSCDISTKWSTERKIETNRVVPSTSSSSSWRMENGDTSCMQEVPMCSNWMLDGAE